MPSCRPTRRRRPRRREQTRTVTASRRIRAPGTPRPCSSVPRELALAVGGRPRPPSRDGPARISSPRVTSTSTPARLGTVRRTRPRWSSTAHRPSSPRSAWIAAARARRRPPSRLDRSRAAKSSRTRTPVRSASSSSRVLELACRPSRIAAAIASSCANAAATAPGLVLRGLVERARRLRGLLDPSVDRRSRRCDDQNPTDRDREDRKDHQQDEEEGESVAEADVHPRPSLRPYHERGRPAIIGWPSRARFLLRTAPRGAIAQLGERLDRTQEVGGSSPPSSIAPFPRL